MANRQKVGRLGGLGALWQAKIFKKCQKDSAFSSKIAFLVENQNLLIFEENAPRLSETYEFEVQGAKRSPLLAPKSQPFLKKGNWLI